MSPLFAEIAANADVMLLCGDLTDYGLAEEARVLAADLQAVKIPIVGVLGNHDLESGEEREVTDVLANAGARMLDGDTFEYRGVGFAGIRGFCGGFGRGALGPWGEKVIKDFVNEAVQEALKLESALQRLKELEHRVVMMHYAPIRETVEGESQEIFAFLGSSRLEEPLTRLGATVVFHGHAHRGAPEGKTSTGIPGVQRRAHGVEGGVSGPPTLSDIRNPVGGEGGERAHGRAGVEPASDRQRSGSRSLSVAVQASYHRIDQR